MPETNDSYLGQGWSFPPAFNKEQRGVEMVADEQDVVQALKILLATMPGERVMRPDFGINMEKLLFQPLNTSLVAYMQDLIRDAILYHEPRLSLNQVSLEAVPEEGLIRIALDVTIRTTNARTNLVYPYYLNEATA